MKKFVLVALLTGSIFTNANAEETGLAKVQGIYADAQGIAFTLSPDQAPLLCALKIDGAYRFVLSNMITGTALEHTVALIYKQQSSMQTLKATTTSCDALGRMVVDQVAGFNTFTTETGNSVILDEDSGLQMQDSN